jgi:hypothetical protein
VCQWLARFVVTRDRDVCVPGSKVVKGNMVWLRFDYRYEGYGSSRGTELESSRMIGVEQYECMNGCFLGLV